MNFKILVAYLLLMEDLINAKAKEFFGIDYVFPFQRLVISNTLNASGYFSKEKTDEAIPKQIVLLPTGAGKSLCFMLPGLLLEGITLIIFPLLSLIADQKRRIEDAKSSAVILKGGLTSDEVKNAESIILANKSKFILTNPETLKNEKFLRILKKANISHAVIDETHTVSQWGESFRPSYLEVGKHLKELNIRLVTAYTATASEYILESVKKNIFLGEQVNIVKGNPDRTNITYSVIPAISKQETLIKVLSEVEKPVIIFHSSRVSAEVTNRFLVSRTGKSDIVYYHAGLTKEQKTKIEEWFFHSDTGVLNATCAYGMGIDKKNVRTVIHISTPTSIESYLQESGRGGRDRNPAKAILIRVSGEDSSKLGQLLDENKRCRREILLEALNSQPEFCSGCDICNKNIELKAYGKLQITAFFKEYKNKYTEFKAAEVLKGFNTFTALSNGNKNIKGFGILSKWDKDSITEGIKTLKNQNILFASHSILNKGVIKYNSYLDSH